MYPYIIPDRVSQKNGILWENGLPSNSYKIQKLGVFWKIYDIGYIMGTKIFKIEEEMTEKMKPKVANPPLKTGRIHCSQYALL